MVPKVGEKVYITLQFELTKDKTYGPYTVTQVDKPVWPSTDDVVHVNIDGYSCSFPSRVVHRYDPLNPRARDPPAAKPNITGLRPGHRTFEFKAVT